MSAAAWRRVWLRPASPSDLWRLTKIAGPSSSQSPLTLGRWWRRPADHHHWYFTLPESSKFYRPGASQVRQFSTANQRQQRARKRHLYLVLDDRQNEYSIYKLDMDNDHLLETGFGSAANPLSLPEPPVRRIGPPTIGLTAQFAAIGSHFVATCGAYNGISRIPCVTLTYDTKTDLLRVSDYLPTGLEFRYDAAIAAKKKLYLIESFTDNNDGLDGPYFRGGLHCVARDPRDNEEDWTWWPTFRSQFNWSCTSNPPDFPFDPKSMVAHAVHPRTGTIFVSARGDEGWGTFSYGARGSGHWKRLGDWVLPFKGCGHYDNVMGAWVGLHLHSVRAKHADGYLCSCRVMSGQESPEWKVGRETILLQHPNWTHVDSKLVHMGEHSKYCLVERLLPKGADRRVDNMKYVLRLTIFTFKYDEDGEIRTMAHWPSRFYKAPSYHHPFDVQGLWM